MAYTPVAIPSLPPLSDPALRGFLTSMKEALEVRLRQRGSALDAAPTFRDLIDAGIFNIKDGATIGGKSYTADQLLGLIEFTLPAWITSDTAPPPPTGLTVTVKLLQVEVTWDASTFDLFDHTEVWRSSSNNLSTATLVGTTGGALHNDALPNASTAYYYWARHVSRNGLKSPFNDVNGAGTLSGPGALSVSQSFVGADVVLSWPTPSSNVAVSLYQIEYLDGTWVTFDVVAGNSARFRVAWPGNRTFRMRALDINGDPGPWAQFDVNVAAHGTPSVVQTFDGESAVMTWAATIGSLPIEVYEVYDTTVAPGNLLARQASTTFRTKVLWASKTFKIVSVDTAGNVGAEASVPIAVSTGVINTFTAEAIDNNVLLRWSSTAGSLPNQTFELRRGASWAGGTVIGKKDGGFTVVFETPQSVTSYTYWLAAIDTAGNYGTPKSVTVSVAQPPDYILAVRWDSDYSGTKSNALLEGGALTIPVNTTQTWADHFTSNSWATPQDQIDAGYPIYIQPGTTTGYYEEDFDYGTLLAAMKVSVSFNLTTLAGSLSTTTTITVAQDSGFSVGVQTFSGVQQAFALNFRYVRVKVEVTATNDAGIGVLSDLSVVLDAKLKSQIGSVSCNAADSGGTTVYLTDDRTSTGVKNFVDVDSIVITAQSTSPVYAVYDFTDVANPLSFKILLFDSSGTRVSGTASYSVRGY